MPGSIFQTTMDSEVFLHLFVKNLNWDSRKP
jgi:glutamine phosphoribosylpyrophosphate amidotransferase